MPLSAAVPATASTMQVEDRLKTLYNIMQSIESRLGGGEGVEGMYGSITRTGMQKIVEAMTRHCGLDANSCLVDIGAGLGRPLLHALVQPGVASGFGVECDKIKCEKAAAFLQQCKRDLCKRGAASDAMQIPAIKCAMIERVKSLDPATHAYSFWEGVPVAGKSAFGCLFAASSSLRAVTVVQRAVRKGEPAELMQGLGFGPLKLVSSFPVCMAGSGRSFRAYVFRRLGEAPRAALPAADSIDAASVLAATPSNCLPLHAKGSLMRISMQAGCAWGAAAADGASLPPSFDSASAHAYVINLDGAAAEVLQDADSGEGGSDVGAEYGSSRGEGNGGEEGTLRRSRRLASRGSDLSISSAASAGSTRSTATTRPAPARCTASTCAKQLPPRVDLAYQQSQPQPAAAQRMHTPAAKGTAATQQEEPSEDDSAAPGEGVMVPVLRPDMGSVSAAEADLAALTVHSPSGSCPSVATAAPEPEQDGRVEALQAGRRKQGGGGSPHKVEKAASPKGLKKLLSHMRGRRGARRNLLASG